MSTSVNEQHAAGVPESVLRVGELMSTYPGTWCLCGGWAVDAWIGRTTREHGDVDIVVLRDELDDLFAHLSGWQLIAHDPNVPGDTSELWDGRQLDLPAHIHGRSPETGAELPDRLADPSKQGFGLDIQVDERAGGDWVCSTEPHITLPFDACVQRSTWGVPALAPEAILYYKSGDPRLRDKLDFAALLPLLGTGQREWLRDALTRAGHPWLSRLA